MMVRLRRWKQYAVELLWDPFWVLCHLFYISMTFLMFIKYRAFLFADDSNLFISYEYHSHLHSQLNKKLANMFVVKH